MLKQSLQQKQLLKLTPQQIQLMKLLQVPTAQLEQRIKEELEANPVLEEPDKTASEEDPYESDTDIREENELREEGENPQEEIDWSEYYDDDEVPNYKTQADNYSKDEEEKTIPIPVEDSFQEHLESQVHMLDLDEREELIALQIIGSIDENGYLKRELIALSDDLAFAHNIISDEEELERILVKVQEFDPPGVGARDLEECLLIQLKNIQEPDEYVRLAIDILTRHFDAFTKKHYEKLQKSLDIDAETLKKVEETIQKLNPKPGSAFSPSARSGQYIVPDFSIINTDGELDVQLNSRNAPDLRVNNTYKNMIEAYDKSKKKSREQKEAVMFIKQKIDSAKWFIDAIRQRQHTLLSIMNAILRFQYDFFLTGDDIKLKPMILKDIAEVTDLDISTVSRVTSQKYVQTEFGTYSLKHFFSESLATDSGEEVSTREVKAILKDLIENEEKRKPLSDQKLTKLLQDKGYQIARRTVAKYREQLNIPVARLRKEL